MIEPSLTVGLVHRIATRLVATQDYPTTFDWMRLYQGIRSTAALIIRTRRRDVGKVRGLFFIAMELIRGVNLEQFSEQLTDKKRTLPTELAVFITSRVARGLAYAHTKTGKDGKPLGIVHRDVSFKNIMIAFEGDVKLTDFGIAKAKGFLEDQEGEEIAGKADYMSPEQADFKITDRRSDLFSAGVVLAHLLLGRNLFKGQNAEESRQRIMNLPVPDFRELIAIGGFLHDRVAIDTANATARVDRLCQSMKAAIAARVARPRGLSKSIPSFGANSSATYFAPSAGSLQCIRLEILSAISTG